MPAQPLFTGLALGFVLLFATTTLTLAADTAEPASQTPLALACDGSPSPGFFVALESLRAWLGASMGEPLGCATQAASDDDELMQPTTTGAAFVNATVGEVSFTDGHRRWAIGPDGPRYWASPDSVPYAAEQPPLTRAVRCPVLYAHEVPSQASLRGLISSLHGAGYRFTSLATVERAMAGLADAPPGCLVLSFDDALYSQYANALPVLSALGVPAVFFAMPAYGDRVHRYMGADELRALQWAGHEIGAHTCNHANLPSLRVLRPIAFAAEIEDCKLTLERIVGVPVVYIAYPNGSFDRFVADAVAAAGYRAAFTTRSGALLSPASAFALPRIRFNVGEAPGAVLQRIRAAGG